ncbi:MAG: circularly permuted type 2 ATP-grasp protein, partial [Aeromicrobium sp.]
LYGAQKLLSRGVLPPSIVFSHPGYLRTAARQSTDDPRPLLVSATDLGRNANGDWEALSDRAQAPSGIGYAMENRRIVSRVLPEMYRDAGLHRLAPFFQTLRAALLDAAPDTSYEPRVVVLTPGTHSETAFDQAYVASSLGFPLVQGSDLTIREGAVWMRVLGRLERVDVILRRVDADWSDPLELRPDSQLGVVGLAEAVRRGTVRVVNGLGSGVLENAGLLPFLPAISEALLGEPLRLPSTETYWCGDPSSRSHVLANLDTLVIRSIDRQSTHHGSILSIAEREILKGRILAEPHRFVGQAVLAFSQMPALVGNQFEPRPVVMRSFSVRQGSTYRPLVGGLANIVDDTRLSMSKDVWVLKERADDPDQLFADDLPFAGLRPSAALVPRVLEDLFWIGRYAERAEDTLRLLIATHAVAEDFRSRPQSAGAGCLRVLLSTLGRLSPSPEDANDPAEEFRALLLDEHRIGSVAQSIGALTLGARGVRDQLSSDIWMVFGDLDRARAALENNPYSHQIEATSNQMLQSLLAMVGVTSNMMRDPGWHLLEIGRAIERSLQLVYLLRATVTIRRGIDIDRQVGSAVLAATESRVTYQRRYRGAARTRNVLDLVLIDPDNPRSLEFQLQRIKRALAALPGANGSTRPERMLDDLITELEQSDLPGLTAVAGEHRPHLDEFLAGMGQRLAEFSLAVTDHHFAPLSPPRAYGPFMVVGP